MLSRILRFLRWLWAPADDLPGHCPICRRPVQVPPNSVTGPGTCLPIPRPVEELVGACRQQHGTDHTEEEIRVAKATRPWR